MKGAGACCAGLNPLDPLSLLFKLMTKLSPAAQAVLDAVCEICPASADEIAAVALKTVADQVEIPNGSTEWSKGYIEGLLTFHTGILAIVSELETGEGLRTTYSNQ